jgi:hypothetical protein
MLSIAEMAVTVTKVSSWWSGWGSSWLERFVESLVGWEEGKMMRLATVGQRSLIRGRKVVSFLERAGRMSIRIERRDRRR